MADDSHKEDMDAAALDALASGGPDRSGDSHIPLVEQQAQERLLSSAGLSEQPDLPDIGQELAAEVPEAAIQGGSAMAQTALAARRAQAHQFTQTMIPLMLVMGGLLLAFSVATAVKLASAGAEAGEMMQTYGWPAVAVAVPLGAILLAGAVLLHRRSRRAGK